jgi:hypothetical protein
MWKEVPATYFEVMAKFFLNGLKKLQVKTDGVQTENSVTIVTLHDLKS